MSPTRDGCLSGTRVRQESGRPPLPRGQRACSRQPRPARGLGVAVRRSAGIAIRRAAAPLGIAHPPSRRSAPRVGVCVCVRVCMCARRGRRRTQGRGPGPPPRPSPAPPPAPRPLLGLAASFRSVRPSAGSSFGSSSASRSGFVFGSRSCSRSRSGSRSDAAALEIWLWRRGGRAAPPPPARRAGAGQERRGRAEPTRCPRSLAEAAAASRAWPCPALPQPRPAAHATAAGSGAPGGGTPPGPQQYCSVAPGSQKRCVAASVIPQMGGRGGWGGPRCAPLGTASPTPTQRQAGRSRRGGLEILEVERCGRPACQPDV